MYDKIQQFRKLVNERDNIVFFGGAGVSTESHIPDFRSTDGLYHQTYKYPPEVMVSHTFYTQHTEEFYDFYKNKMIFLDAKPNKAHLKLAEMEQAGKLSAIVTQNIDGLHQAAGSKNVFELHGSVHRNYCQKCGKFFDVNYVVNASKAPNMKTYQLARFNFGKATSAAPICKGKKKFPKMAGIPGTMTIKTMMAPW